MCYERKTLKADLYSEAIKHPKDVCNQIEQELVPVRKNPRHARGFLHPDPAAVGGVVRVSKISFYGTDFGI
jgi:hypothetical protein